MRLIIFLLLLTSTAYGQKTIHFGNTGGTGGATSKFGNEFVTTNDTVFLKDYAFIKNYGAVSDGVTNDLPAIVAAVASGKKNIVIPVGTTLVTGSANTSLISLSQGQTLMGEGPGAILKTTSNARIIDLHSQSFVRDLTLLGSSSKSSTSNQYQSGVYFSTDDTAWMVQNVIFKDFGGDNSLAGGAIYGGLITSGSSIGGSIVDCYIENSRTGIVLKSRSEYINVINTSIANCGTGFYKSAGNVSFFNSNVRACDTAFKASNGTNDGHSITSGLKLNHNTYNMVIEGLTLGDVYMGIMVYSGNNIIRNTTNVRFIGCDFTTGTTYLTNNVNLQRTDCKWRYSDMTTSIISGQDFAIFGEVRQSTTPNWWVKQVTADSNYFAGPFMVDLPAGQGTKEVRYNATTKRFYAADTTVGGGGGFGTTTLTGNVAITGAANSIAWNGIPSNIFNDGTTNRIGYTGTNAYINSPNGFNNVTSDNTRTTIEGPVRMTDFAGAGNGVAAFDNDGDVSFLAIRKTGTTASSGTPTPTGDAYQNTYTITALATNPTFSAPSGTAVDQNTLLIRITDNGTTRTLSWNAIYDEGADLSLPTATIAGETMYVQFVYNSAVTKWQLIGRTGGF